jgi:hypothetical protein
MLGRPERVPLFLDDLGEPTIGFDANRRSLRVGFSLRRGDRFTERFHVRGVVDRRILYVSRRGHIFTKSQAINNGLL